MLYTNNYKNRFGASSLVDPYYCFRNNCPKINYNLFKPRLQDDSLYPIKHSVLDQYGKSDFDYKEN